MADGGAAEVMRVAMVAEVERRWIHVDPLAAFVTRNRDAEAAMAAAAELPEGLRPARLTRFDPAAAEEAATRYAQMRNLNGDRLVRLYERGRIMAAELRAGRELCLVMEWRQGAHTPLGRTGGYMQRMAASTGMEAVPLWQVMQGVEADRFVPWQGWCKAFPPIKESVGIADLVQLVVLGNRGIRQAADLYAMDQRRVLALLRRALHRYARIAGWVAEDAPAEIPG